MRTDLVSKDELEASAQELQVAREEAVRSAAEPEQGLNRMREQPKKQMQEEATKYMTSAGESNDRTVRLPPAGAPAAAQDIRDDKYWN